MNWDFVLPGVKVTDTVQASEPAMTANEQRTICRLLRAFRPPPVGLSRPESPAIPRSPTTSCRKATSVFSAHRPPATAKWSHADISSASPAISCATTGGAQAPHRSTTFPRILRLNRTSQQIGLMGAPPPAMARMRPRDRQLLWLAHAENYSHREIAEITGLGDAQHPPPSVSRQKKNRSHPHAGEPSREGTSCGSISRQHEFEPPGPPGPAGPTRPQRPEAVMKPCPHEPEVQAILRRGHWPEACDPEFRKHVETCRTCGEQLLVLHAFHDARTQAMQAARLDHPNLIWWRAQLRRRNDALQRVSRPITTAQIFALCVGILAVAALLRSQMRDGFNWSLGSQRLSPLASTLYHLFTSIRPIGDPFPADRARRSRAAQCS